MSSLTVQIRGLSGSLSIEVPEGATVADVREAAGINDGLTIRADGATVADESATAVTLPVALSDGLEAIEAELGVSIGCGRSHWLLATPTAPFDVWLCHGAAEPGYSLASLTLTPDDYSIDALLPASPPPMPIVYNDCLIGEIRAGKVYEYLNLRNPRSQDIYELFLNAIRQCVEPAFLAEDAARETEATERALREFVRTSYDRGLATYRNEIDAEQGRITVYRDSLARSFQALRSQQDLLDALILVQRNDGGERLLGEWARLGEHPRITARRFAEPSSLVLTTSDDVRLHNPDTGESRWLGRFEITIDVATLEVRLRNLDTQRGGRDHPHVVAQRPCFGGAEGDFAELLGRGELYVIVELLFQYLETLNLRDEYGRYGAYWFDRDDERPLTSTETEVAA